MSIGPSLSESDTITIRLRDRARAVIQKAGQRYFTDPPFFLFWTLLPSMIIGLYIGLSFSIPLYAILVILACIEMYREFRKNDQEEKL